MTPSQPVWKRIAWGLARVLGQWLAPVALLVLRLSSRKRGVVLMYHGVEDRAGDPDQLVPALATDTFEKQVRHLERHYRIVLASEFLPAVEKRRRGDRFPVALTFDDDLRCHVATVLPVFARHGVRGTFFLTGASLEHPRSFWWERLDRASARGAPDLADVVGMPDTGGRPSVAELGAFVRHLDAESRAAVDARLAEVAGSDPPDAGLRLTDVRGLVEAGNEIGFHTLRHDNLVRLPDDELAAAMVEGREALAKAAGMPLETICYPYGYVDERVANAARSAGFAAGFTTESVPAPDGDPLRTGRLGPPLDHGVFAAKLVATLALRRYG